MIHKYLINPQRPRRIPKQFSWVDHRLVQAGYLQRCSQSALALYLFLLCVADAEGLSYYSDRSVGNYLAMNEPQLDAARCELVRVGLIAFAHPLYQVLGLQTPRRRVDPPSVPSAQQDQQTPPFKSLGQLLGEFMENSDD